MAIEGSELAGLGSVDTAGGAQAAGTPFPGFGGVPPAIAAAGSAGVALTASRSDHTHVGVASFNGALGAVGYAPTKLCANIAALQALATIGALTAGGLQTGQEAFVAATREMFELQAATAGAANGVNIVATSDDATRQWVLQGLLSGDSPRCFASGDVDVTVTATHTLIPAITGYVFFPISGRVRLVSGAGSCTGAGPYKAGNNGAHDNVLPPNNLTSALMNSLIPLGPNAFIGNSVAGSSAATAYGPALNLSSPVLLDVTAMTGTGLTLHLDFMVFGRLCPV